MSRQVLTLLYDGFSAIDATGPSDVLNAANELSRAQLYHLRFVSERGEVRASNGMRYSTERIDEVDPLADMLLVPGAEARPMREALGERRLTHWIQQVAERAQRVCSVCSGAFLLARAGLLEGRRATTHWRGLDSLAASFPSIRLERDVLFVEDGPFWTSAGVTAGIDMALAIVERDHGRPLAMRVAREMVLFLVRPGGQAQFSAPLDLQHRSASSDLSALPFWLEERLSETVSVADMAAAMAMSERNFHRRCVAAFGLTPNALLGRLRLERARMLLEADGVALKDVARQCGFSDHSALGKHFRQHFGVTPGDYRAHFGRASLPSLKPRTGPES